MDRYEIITYLQTSHGNLMILKQDYINVDYEVDDRDSFVYTRTRRIRRDIC